MLQRYVNILVHDQNGKCFEADQLTLDFMSFPFVSD